MTQTKFPWTYIFVGIVGVFVAWVYLAEYKGGEERQKVKAEASALLPFSNSNVTEISIRTNPTGEMAGVPASETVAKKSDGVWKFEKPFSDLGDPATIETFLSTISNEKVTETVVEAADIAWKMYGLDRPTIDATITSKVGAGAAGLLKRSILIGSVPAFDGSVYARLDGENRVVLLSSTARAVFQKDPRDLRDKHFFPSKESPKFTSIEISRPGFSKLTLIKSADVWMQKETGKDSWPLDQGVAKAYADSVAGLRGNDVWAEDKTDPKVLRMRKLDRPGLNVSLFSEKSEKYDVKIAPLSKAESVAAGFGSARPLVFSVYKAQIELLSKTIDDFRDLAYPFKFKISDVQAIELERPAGSVSLPILAKKEGKWITDPLDTRFAGREAKSELVDRLMSEINAFSAAKMLPGLVPVPKLGPKGSLRMSFFGEKSKKLAEFIFNLSGETVRVTSSVAPARVFEIEKSLLDALTLDVVTAAPETVPSTQTEKSGP